MSKSSTKTNVTAGTGPALPTAPSNERTQPKEFANIGALLAQVPSPDGNPFALWPADLLRGTGASMVNELSYRFAETGDDRHDMEGRSGGMIAAGIMKRAGMMNAGRVLSGLCGSFAYSLAYAEASVEQLQSLNTRIQNDLRDGDREGVWGLATAAERGVVTVNARQAECYRLGEIIRGAVDAYEEAFGEKYVLRAAPGRVSSKAKDEAAKAVSDRLAGVLARVGKSAA